MEPTTILASIDPWNGVGETVFDSRTREPVMLDKAKMGTARSRLGLAAVALASCLMLATPWATLARQPSANDWVGKPVVPKGRELHPQRCEDGIAGQRAGGDLSRRSGEWQVGPARRRGDHRLGADRPGRAGGAGECVLREPDPGQSGRIVQSHDAGRRHTRASGRSRPRLRRFERSDSPRPS